MKAIGFSIDFADEYIDCIAYLSNVEYNIVHELYQELGENDMELWHELELPDYKKIYDKILSYAALGVCMSNAQYGISEYSWSNILSLDYFNFGPKNCHLSSDIYIKSLFYSQWRIEDSIVNLISSQNSGKEKRIRHMTRLHNARYQKSFVDWMRTASSNEYAIEQYSREIDGLLERKNVSVEVLDRYAHKYQELFLPARYIKALLRKLDEAYNDITGQGRVPTYSSEAEPKPEQYKEPPSKSIRAILTPMGGQNKWRK